MRTPMMVVFAALLLTPPVAAQTILGRLVEDSTGTAIVTGTIFLLDRDSIVVSSSVADSLGRFTLQAPAHGVYLLRAEAIGYHAGSSNDIDVSNADTVEVQLRLSAQAVPLQPLVVTARTARLGSDLAGFYRRAREGRRGTFITRDAIDTRSPYRTTELLRSLPGVRLITSRGNTGSYVVVRGSCEPAVFIDGVHVPLYGHTIDDFIRVTDIEGIEFYRMAGELPAEYSGHDSCAAILIWTRRR